MERLSPFGRFDEIATVAVHIGEDDDFAVWLSTRLLCEADSSQRPLSDQSVEIVCVQEERNSAGRLVADRSFLAFVWSSGEEEAGAVRVWSHEPHQMVEASEGLVVE